MGTTVGSLRRCKHDWFLKCPYVEDVIVGYNNVYVRYLHDGQLVLIEDDNVPLVADGFYEVTEEFELAPVDLIRNIRIHETDTVVYAHPKARGQFTDVAPILCGALKSSETRFPARYPTGEHQTESVGMSFWATDMASNIALDQIKLKRANPKENSVTDIQNQVEATNIHDSNSNMVDDAADTKNDVDEKPVKPLFNPFNPPPPRGKDGEQTGLYSIPPEHILELRSNEAESHEYVGLLFSELTHVKIDEDADELQCRFEEGKIYSSDGKRKRLLYWRWILQQFTNLAQYGCRAVFDNTNKGHVSVERVEKGTIKKWNAGIFLPRGCRVLWPERKAPLVHPPSDDDLEAIYTSEESPERAVQQFLGLQTIVIPGLAAHATLYDFMFEAKAEPRPIANYEDPEQLTIHRALLIFYHAEDVCENSQAYKNDSAWIIEEFERGDYLLKDVDDTAKLCLADSLRFLRDDIDFEEHHSSDFGLELTREEHQQSSFVFESSIEPVEILNRAISLIDGGNPIQVPKTPFRSLPLTQRDTNSGSPDSATSHETDESDDVAHFDLHRQGSGINAIDDRPTYLSAL